MSAMEIGSEELACGTKSQYNERQKYTGRVGQQKKIKQVYQDPFPLHPTRLFEEDFEPGCFPLTKIEFNIEGDTVKYQAVAFLKVVKPGFLAIA